MAELNSFVMAHVEELFYFLDEISSTHGAINDPTAHTAGAASGALAPADAEQALCHVVASLAKHRDAVLKELAKRGAEQSPQWQTVARVIDQASSGE